MEDKELEDKFEAYLKKREDAQSLQKLKDSQPQLRYKMLPNDKVLNFLHRNDDWVIVNLELDEFMLGERDFFDYLDQHNAAPETIEPGIMELFKTHSFVCRLFYPIPKK